MKLIKCNELISFLRPHTDLVKLLRKSDFYLVETWSKFSY
jgi:hypothetical protein